MKKDPTPWTPEEDSILLEALASQAEEEDSPNWLRIATLLDGRSNKDCRKRWAYSLSPSIHKGPWSDHEDASLKEGLARYGTRWAQVSRFVRTRQPDQCSRRWHEVLKPDLDRGRWSLAENVILRNAVEAHGRHWIEIVERYFPNRSPVATRHKYNQILKREMKSSGGTMNIET